MDLDAVPARNPSAVFRIYDGEATVVLPDRAEVNVLNETGTLVWQQIDGRRSLREIVRVVVEEYGVAPEQAEQDVLELIGSLREHQMVS